MGFLKVLVLLFANGDPQQQGGILRPPEEEGEVEEVAGAYHSRNRTRRSGVLQSC